MSNLRAATQQERAKWAWDAVSKVGDGDDTYLREARKLPARLLTSGMGQTMAYLHAKGDDKAQGGIALLYAQLSERLRDSSIVQRRQSPRPRTPGMEIIVRLDPQEYRLLSRDILASSEWIKRFAEGKGNS